MEKSTPFRTGSARYLMAPFAPFGFARLSLPYRRVYRRTNSRYAPGRALSFRARPFSHFRAVVKWKSNKNLCVPIGTLI